MLEDDKLYTGLERILLSAHDSRSYPFKSLLEQPPKAPRWPSGVRGIDDNIAMEGFYGVSAICGRQKLGKSMCAWQSALQAVLNGWTVVYVDAEMDDWQAAERIRRATNAEPIQWCREHPEFAWRQLDEPTEMTVLVKDVVAHVGNADRVLVVLDSLQSVAQWIVRSDRSQVDFYDAMRGLVRWAVTARRRSRGAVSFLMTSERNQAGRSKGEQLEHAGDMMLKVTGKSDERTVKLDVDFSREGGAGELGKYLRDWERCRFKKVAEDEPETEQQGSVSGVTELGPNRLL